MLRPLIVVSCALLLRSIPHLAAQNDRQAALLEADRYSAKISGDSGFAVAVQRSFDGSGVLLWPQAPILAGKNQVSAFLSSQQQAPVSLTWQPLGQQLSADSTVGVTWGVAAQTRSAPTVTPALGRYISVWRRTADRWTVSALVLIGIGETSEAPAGVPLSRPAARPRNDTAPFIAADLAFARLAGDSGAAVAFRTWADGDALIFGGGGGLLIRGPEAIGRAVAGPARWVWHPVLAGSSRAGDLGWTVGEAVITGAEGEPSYSKYLTVWTRRGGTTRFILDGGNARPRSP